MFNKRSRIEKDTSTDAQRARVITTSFSGLGICGREGEIWICFDAEAALLYASANRVRTEPKPSPLLTEADLLRQEGWTKAQLAAARTAGFPAPTGRRDFYDGDGVPNGSEPLWHPEVVRQWVDRVRSLPVGGR